MPAHLDSERSVAATPSLSSILDTLLREQQAMSAVETFSRRMAADQTASVHRAGRTSARHYHQLLPAAPPGPGEQYAFDVDLDACSGCKSCVTACHALNGLEEGETFRDVGLLIGGTSTAPVLQHVTAACHHCLEPACLEVCPTLSYIKDPLTGIVKHLDDQCFGCQYCILACPYEVPQYSHQRGIVRKCDMCSSRLQVGEAPACAQACPNQAISIRIVRTGDVQADCEVTAFLPGAPDPQLTLPTTTYRSVKPFPRNLLPADYYSSRAAHAHLPLVAMLVLTQLSVGAFWVNALLPVGKISLPPAGQQWQSLSALLLGFLALGAATLHLGRPQYAFRALLGLRRSWLSREIVVFGLFAGLATWDAARQWFSGISRQSPDALTGSVLLAGSAGVGCSIMIYQCTGRVTWTGLRTFLRFFGTTAWLGLATTLLIDSLLNDLLVGVSGSRDERLLQTIGPLLIGVALAKLCYEASDLVHLTERQFTPLKHAARLLVGELAGLTSARFVLGLGGGVLLPLLVLTASAADHPLKRLSTVVALWLFSVVGEFLERGLYFMAATAPRMPGRIRS